MQPVAESSSEPKPPRLWPIYLAGAAEDFSLYLFFGVLYFLVLFLGGDAGDLGIISGTASISYVVGAIVGGRLADRLPRLTLARIGCVIYAFMVLAIGRSQDLGPIRVLVIPVGLSMGLFWPPVQAHLGDLVSRARLAKTLGRFNIFWSLGKSSGFFAAGILVEVLTPSQGRLGAISITITLASIVGLAPLLLVRRQAPEGREVDRAPTGEGIRERPRGAPFRHLAWIANFSLFGTGTALVTHHPNWITQSGLREIHSDAFLGAVFLSQTAAFLLWSTYTRWKYRLREFFVVQGVFIVVVAAVPFVGGFGATLLLAPLIGLGLGIAYQASIYYSLSVEGARGRSTGLHEGILGSGNFLLPLLGGWAAEWSRDVRAPYLLAAGVGVVALGLQAALASRSSRAAGSGSS